MNVPEDVIFQILSKLPAKSLIRFKCVCKSWYALLEDHSFILTHTINLTKRNPDGDHLLISCRDNSTNKRVISISTDSLLDRFINQQLPSSFSNNNYGQMRLIGPCNGIVCLYGYHDHIALFNPTLGEFKNLPSSLIPRPTDTKVRGGDVGIGYDPNTDDYKVIQILFCISSHHELVYQVEIYSLSSNSWRKYDAKVPANVMHTNIWSMVYKNKTFCWWAKNDDHMEVILSFDMGKEVFQETPLPCEIEEFGGKKRTTRAIMPWNGQIGVVVYKVKEVDKVFDIWILSELGLGGKECCWSKVSRIGGIVGVERPLGFWKNGELILENHYRELVLYDPDNKEIKNLGLCGKRGRLELVVYNPTLVSVNQYKN